MLTAVATMKGEIGLSRKPSPFSITDWSYLTAPAPKQLPKGGVLFIPLWLVYYYRGRTFNRSLAPISLHPPHAANRHYAGAVCGADCVAVS